MSQALAQAFDEYADTLDETTMGSGLTYLESLRDKSLALLQNGELNTFVNTTANGQTFGSQVELPANTMFETVMEAIRIHKGRCIKMTHPAFSQGIPH